MEASPPNLRHLKINQRSQSPPPPSSKSMLTRSKFQMYVHLNRSGWARHDAVQKPDHQFVHLTRSRRRKRNSAEYINEDIPMKDLRARRVFSTGPTCVDADSKPGDQYDQKTMNPENSNDCVPIEEALCAGRVFSSGPARSPSEEDIREDTTSLENGRKSDTGLSGNVDLCGSDEGNGAMVNKSVENLDNQGEKLVESSVMKTADNEKESGKYEMVLDVRSDPTKGFTSSSKMAVNFYARRKVFKAPGSFSYRRLLPFLKDIAEDESCILKTEIVNEGFPAKFKNSTNGSCNMNVNNVTSNLKTGMEYSSAVKCKNESEHSEDGRHQNGVNHEIEVQSISKLQKADTVNNNINVIPGDCRLDNGKVKDEEVSVNGGDELMEDCIQMTPPDADIFSKLECYGGNAVGKCVDVNGVCENILKEAIGANNVPNKNNSRGSPNQKNGTLSKTKLVLNPCSRLKVFKPFGSVSYRKLLPYLTSVAAEDSCVSKSINQANAQELKACQDPATSASPSVEIHEEIIPESSLEEKRAQSEEQKQTSPTVPPTYGSDDNPNPNPSVRQSGSGSDSYDSEPRSVVNSNIGHCPTPLKPDAVEPSSFTKLEPHLSCNNLKSLEGERSCPEVIQCPKTCHELQPTCPTLELALYEGDGNDRVYLKQSSSSNEACDEPGKNLDGPRKGILKRNPRGCRGTCNCLSCSSFRLNAERAFEFSRHQMQDAEEIVLDLMKEVAGLRHLLENSAAKASDPAVFQLNQLQTEEACRKALAKEELAKARLREMNKDLKIHCRIRSLQRPRVAFSSQCDEQKVFPSSKD